MGNGLWPKFEEKDEISKAVQDPKEELDEI